MIAGRAAEDSDGQPAPLVLHVLVQDERLGGNLRLYGRSGGGPPGPRGSRAPASPAPLRALSLRKTHVLRAPRAGQRQLQREPRPAVARCGRETTAVFVRDRRGDRKTPAPRPAPTAGPARQLIHRGGQPRPAVCHLDPDGTYVHSYADRDGSPTMLYCVRDQVVESLGESEPVAVDNRRAPGAAHIDPSRPRVSRRAPRLGAVGEQRGKVHVREALLCLGAAARLRRSPPAPARHARARARPPAAAGRPARLAARQAPLPDGRR